MKKLKAYKLWQAPPRRYSLHKNAIREVLNDQQPVPVTVERIIAEVGRTCGVSPQDIRSNKRSATISSARQVSIYIVREITQMSMAAIGERNLADRARFDHCLCHSTGRKEYESGLPLPGNGRGYYQEYSKHLIFHGFHYFTIHSLWKTFWFILFFPHFQPSFQHFLNFTPLLLLKKIRLFVFFHLFTFFQRCAQQEKKSVIPFYYADLRTHFHKSTAPTTKTKLFYFFILSFLFYFDPWKKECDFIEI